MCAINVLLNAFRPKYISRIRNLDIEKLCDNMLWEYMYKISTLQCVSKIYSKTHSVVSHLYDMQKYFTTRPGHKAAKALIRNRIILLHATVVKLGYYFIAIYRSYIHNRLVNVPFHQEK